MNAGFTFSLVMRLIRVLAFVVSGILSAGTAAAQPGARPGVAEIAPVVVADHARAGTDVEVVLQVRLPEGLHVNSNMPRDPALIPLTLTVNAPPGVTVAGVAFPKPADLRQQGQDTPLRVFAGAFAIAARLRLAPDLASGPLRVPARVRYQACDAVRCYVPAVASTEWGLSVVPRSTSVKVLYPEVLRDLIWEAKDDTPRAAPTPTEALEETPAVDATNRLDHLAVARIAGGYLGSRDFLAFLHDAESGAVASRAFEGRSTLAIVFAVLVGGLALNLTPCVFPLIPINLAILGAGSAAASRRRGFLLGTAYGGAMAAVYGGLGLIVILTSRAFGAINASPWFNAGIAVVFIALALSMFDVFFIDFSRLSSRLRLDGARGSFGLAISMGGVAALLAGACVAPVVIQVVVFAGDLYASGSHSALALPFVLGLGMAAPWPFAGAGLASLPKPGAWMVRVKQALGVVILLLAAYYAHTAYERFSDRAMTGAATLSAADDGRSRGWFSSIDEGLAVAEREHRAVLVDLWATWCKNCLVMDQTTLADPAVKAALAGYIKIKFQAEDPNEPRARDVMQRFGAIGLPTYVVLRPKTTDVRSGGQYEENAK